MGAVLLRGANVAGAETWESARGQLTITYPAPSVMLFTYGGHLTADVVPFVDAAVDRALKAGLRPQFFVDLEQVSSYDSEYRQAIKTWGLRVDREVAGWFFLVRSRLVAMGVKFSSMWLQSPVKATAERSEFDAALQAAARRGA